LGLENSAPTSSLFFIYSFFFAEHLVVSVFLQNTIGSSWLHDLLWTFFSLYTVYEVTVLEPMEKFESETAAEFSDRVRKVSHSII